MLYRYATSGVPETTAGWRAWRIRITEEDVGAWMMHCHVLQHMIMGKSSLLDLDSANVNTPWQVCKQSGCSATRARSWLDFQRNRM